MRAGIWHALGKDSRPPASLGGGWAGGAAPPAVQWFATCGVFVAGLICRFADPNKLIVSAPGMFCLGFSRVFEFVSLPGLLLLLFFFFKPFVFLVSG